MSVETIALSDGSTVETFDMESYLNKSQSVIVTSATAKGISGFVFDIPSGESVDQSADITDHWTESGAFVNDHAVIKPVRITLSGFVGNLVYNAPQPGELGYALSALSDKLSAVNAYLGPFTDQYSGQVAAAVQRAAYIANQAKAIAKRVTNLVNYFAGNGQELNPQQEAYIQLSSLFRSKQIVTCQTPWEFFPSMMIESISSSQDENSTEITSFSIVLKEVRFTEVKTTTFDQDLFPPAQSQQAAEAVSNGPVQGQADNSSFLYKAFGSGQ
jgi:hypothetical protein